MGCEEDETDVDKAVKEAIKGWIAEGEKNEDDLKAKLVDLCNKIDSVGDIQSNAKRQKLSDDNTDEASDGTRHTSESLPKTLKEMALFIFDHCREGTELDRFRIIIGNPGEEKVVSVSNCEFRELFRDAITGYEETDFVSISFGRRSYYQDEFDAEAALVDMNSVIHPRGKTVEEIKRVCGSTVERDDDLPTWEVPTWEKALLLLPIHHNLTMSPFRWTVQKAQHLLLLARVVPGNLGLQNITFWTSLEKTTQLISTIPSVTRMLKAYRCPRIPRCTLHAKLA